MSEPIFFGEQSMIDYFNMQPSEVKGKANNSTEYYKRMLYTKLYSTLEFSLPSDWDLNYFRFWLFHYGSIAVIYTKEYGWVAQPYSIEELNIYYNPKVIRVYNQFIKEVKRGVIGVNAGIIKVMDDYYGLDDIVTRYAEMLAQCDRSVNVNLMNSNVTAFFQAESKKQADEIKEAYEKATSGAPFVAVNKDVMDGRTLEPMFPGVATNFIADKLLGVRRGIINAFLTEIGIRNANFEKRERLNSQEVEENNDETRAVISVIYDNIKSSMNKINEFSGLGLDVRMRYDYKTEGGDENVE